MTTPLERADGRRFLEALRSHRDWFDATAPVIVARAPGRLDVMGGIADYSGSLVLELPLAAAAFTAAQWSGATPHVAAVRTTDAAAAHGDGEVSMSLADLTSDYTAVRQRFAREPRQHWAAYVLGAITVLHHERGVALPRGVRWLLASDVPAGKGVASSAAVEVAAMSALCGLLNLRVDARSMALLCQQVEQLVVGAPCGVMDQMTSAAGRANQLLALRCQPAELEPPVPVPDAVEFVGIDSGIRHAVTGADYGSVRAGAFMGYRILADAAGLAVEVSEGRARINDTRWGGYLANVTPAEWEREWHDLVPERMSGRTFLDRYGGSPDTVTRVNPDREYAVRAPTAHPIYEHARVRRFRDVLIGGALDDGALRELGALMYASHASYSRCGLGTDGTDAIVELARRAGPERGVFGAKITGGGSGGTVAVLVRRGSDDEIRAIVEEYTRVTGRAAAVIRGTSDGVSSFTRPAAAASSSASRSARTSRRLRRPDRT